MVGEDDCINHFSLLRRKQTTKKIVQSWRWSDFQRDRFESNKVLSLMPKPGRDSVASIIQVISWHFCLESWQPTFSSENPNLLRLEIQVENSLLHSVGEVSSMLPAVTFFYAECCSNHIQFMHRKTFSHCWIPATHCLTGDMNSQYLLETWHYSPLFTPSHNTSALIGLIKQLCHEEQLELLCRISNLASALTFSFIHYVKERHTPGFPIIQH